MVQRYRCALISAAEIVNWLSQNIVRRRFSSLHFADKEKLEMPIASWLWLGERGGEKKYTQGNLRLRTQ